MAPDLYRSYFLNSCLKAQGTTINKLFIREVAAATMKFAPAYLRELPAVGGKTLLSRLPAFHTICEPAHIFYRFLHSKSGINNKREGLA